jgi:hypothetical protein
VRFGSASELLNRLQADFSVDRPHGPAGSGFHDGDMHRSVHFTTQESSQMSLRLETDINIQGGMLA